MSFNLIGGGLLDAHGENILIVDSLCFAFLWVKKIRSIHNQTIHKMLKNRGVHDFKLRGKKYKGNEKQICNKISRNQKIFEINECNSASSPPVLLSPPSSSH